MGERLDAAITNVQDFVLDRIGGIMTEMEAADLTGRIILLVNESRFPFEMELVDMSYGVVVTVPEQLSAEEVFSIKRSMAEKIGPDIKLFVCRGNISIQKFHADLVLAARRFVEKCYACRGTGVVEKEDVGSARGVCEMNCGVCCDIRAALSFFDKHNIPQSREKDTLPATVEFRNGDPVLYEKKQAVFDTYLRSVPHGDDRGWHYEETTEPQPLARIRFGPFGTSTGKDFSVVRAEKLQPWVHSSDSLPPAPEHDV